MIRINTIGFDDLATKFRNAAKDVQDEIGMEIADAAQQYVGLAKKSAPVSNSTLWNSIDAQQIGKHEWDVFVRAYYAPFVEFGTKGRYSNPEGWEVPKYSKGSRSMADFIRNLMPWAERTGYLNKVLQGDKSPKAKENAVKWLAIKILKRGLEPRPFFFIHYTKVRDDLRKNLERVLNNVTK